MTEFETLSREQKLDMVLTTMLVYGDGVIADKTLAQIYHSELIDLSEITEFLHSGGFVEVEKFDTPDEWTQLTITPEGRLFTAKGGYSTLPLESQIVDISEYVKSFHRFSYRMHLLRVRAFWITLAGLSIGCFYLLWRSFHFLEK